MIWDERKWWKKNIKMQGFDLGVKEVKDNLGF